MLWCAFKFFFHAKLRNLLKSPRHWWPAVLDPTTPFFLDIAVEGVHSCKEANNKHHWCTKEMPDFQATRKSGIQEISVQIFFLLPVFYTLLLSLWIGFHQTYLSFHLEHGLHDGNRSEWPNSVEIDNLQLNISNACLLENQTRTNQLTGCSNTHPWNFCYNSLTDKCISNSVKFSRQFSVIITVTDCWSIKSKSTAMRAGIKLLCSRLQWYSSSAAAPCFNEPH